ncbi:MAG TPA: DUF1571 domain-containing protein [Pararobbsia sp.]|jgi:hypothetical protein|nr:DUF1571 domain-containing protein [Pararobbsia sp.]
MGGQSWWGRVYLVGVLVAFLPAAAAASDALPDLSKLSADAQAEWLTGAARDGTLDKLDDDALVTLFKGVSSEGLASYVEHGVEPLGEYEFEMLRQERVNQRWPREPEHIAVRYRQSPLQIYAKWLPGGPHKGQEVLYDETRRANQMFGHLGGLLSAVSIWASVNGPFARAQSNHSILDIGLQYVAHRYASEVAKFHEAGIDYPTDVEVTHDRGMRLVVFTYESPVGQPTYYAKRERLGIDLQHPWFRSVESFDNDGQVFERIFYDKVVPRQFDDATFDPTNADYRF